eukprot:gene14984-6138_t
MMTAQMRKTRQTYVRQSLLTEWVEDGNSARLKLLPGGDSTFRMDARQRGFSLARLRKMAQSLCDMDWIGEDEFNTFIDEVTTAHCANAVKDEEEVTVADFNPDHADLGNLRHMQFGGKHIILMGDPAQLPAIERDIFDSFLWRKFSIVMLKDIKRHDDETFQHMLSTIRLRKTNCEIDDILRTKVVSIDDIDAIDLGNAAIICSFRRERNHWNSIFLEKLDTELFTFDATDSHANHQSSLSKNRKSPATTVLSSQVISSQATHIHIPEVPTLKLSQIIKTTATISFGNQPPKAVFFFRTGETLHVEEDCIADDSSGSTELHLWEPLYNSIQHNKMYLFKNLVIKSYKGVAQLTSRTDTSFEERNQQVHLITGHDVLEEEET